MARIAQILRVTVSLSLVLAGAGFAVYGCPLGAGRSFAGEMRIPLKQTARLAFSVSGMSHVPQQEPGSSQGPIYRGVPGLSIVQAEPEAAGGWLEPEATYDVARLPFLVRVTSVTPLNQKAPCDYLHEEGHEE